MPRPDTQHEERKTALVRAATAVFARCGYEGASNRLIAEEVRRSTGRPCTPALLYHYFPDGKAALFSAVLGQHEPLQSFGRALQDAPDAPPEVFLRRAARAYLAMFEDAHTARLARIVISEGRRHPELTQNLVRHIGPLILMPVIGYLQRQAEAGRLRTISPLAAVLQFFGPLFMRGIMVDVLGKTALPYPLLDDETLIESHVRTFLEGLRIEDRGPRIA